MPPMPHAINSRLADSPESTICSNEVKCMWLGSPIQPEYYRQTAPERDVSGVVPRTQKRPVSTLRSGGYGQASEDIF